MIDHFAVLRQRRRPWLDLDELKKAFHARTLRAHPDAQIFGADADSVDTDFTAINEAYQVLRDSKRRLHHLLEIEALAAQGHSALVPVELADLFPTVAQLMHRGDRLAQKKADATNTLARSLLQTEVIQWTQQLEAALGRLQQLEMDADAQLQQIDAVWENGVHDHIPRLQELYVRYSYLQRWIAQLNDKRAQFSG